MADQFLSTADAADVLDVTTDAVRAAARKGRLKVAGTTVGGIRLFRRADVEAYKKTRDARERVLATGTRG